MKNKPEVLEALRLVEAGATVYAAARDTGVAQSTIHRALKRRAATCQACGGSGKAVQK